MALSQIRYFAIGLFGRLGSLGCKGLQALPSIENAWMWHLVLQQCGHVYFPSHYQMMIKMLFNMVDKTNKIYVIPTLASCIRCTCSFNLWMSLVGFDTFAIVVSFIISWEACHVTIRIFGVVTLQV